MQNRRTYPVDRVASCEAVAKQITKLRTAKGWSKSLLSRMARVERCAAGKAEAGRPGVVSAICIRKLFAALGAEPPDLSVWSATHRHGRQTQRSELEPFGDGVLEQRLSCAIGLAIHTVRMRSGKGRDAIRASLEMASYERAIKRPSLATLVEVLDGFEGSWQSFGGAFTKARKELAGLSQAELRQLMLDRVK